LFRRYRQQRNVEWGRLLYLSHRGNAITRPEPSPVVHHSRCRIGNPAGRAGRSGTGAVPASPAQSVAIRRCSAGAKGFEQGARLGWGHGNVILTTEGVGFVSPTTRQNSGARPATERNECPVEINQRNACQNPAPIHVTFLRPPRSCGRLAKARVRQKMPQRMAVFNVRPASGRCSVPGTRVCPATCWA